MCGKKKNVDSDLINVLIKILYRYCLEKSLGRL